MPARTRSACVCPSSTVKLSLKAGTTQQRKQPNVTDHLPPRALPEGLGRGAGAPSMYRVCLRRDLALPPAFCSATDGRTRILSPSSPKKAKKRAEGANSNVFSMFEQTQIQEFKEAFTIMDQNRDGFIDKNDLRDTFAALGRVNVKNEEIDEMLKEAPGPINFTVFLQMFGEKLKGADPEETILNAFKVFDPEGKGVLRADYVKEMLTTQAERFSKEEIEQMFAAFPPDVTGNLDYKNLVHIITHGEEKD
ncbi:myosin regulatory light chain 2, ventricular/cardiac muscle isoform [Camelus ferus]|nr:myosin regulatory light chain 2, ventricular/cardiac muscle isoform [Camelus ferus]